MADTQNPVSLTVEIGGEKYAIRSTADREEVERCARFLDENISEVHRRAGLMDAYKATILAALSITARYFAAQAELAALRARMALRSGSLAEEVEAELAEEVEAELAEEVEAELAEDAGS